MNIVYRKIFEGFIFIILQVLLFKNSILDDNFCFIYIGFLFFIPHQINKIALLFIAFGFGFMIDIFYNSLGIHIATCVLWAYLYSNFFSFVAAQYNIKQIYILPERSTLNYISFSFIFIFVHHLAFFMIEAYQIKFFSVLVRSLISSCLTFGVLLVIYQFFYRRAKIRR